jgi:hypothetical protein
MRIEDVLVAKQSFGEVDQATWEFGVAWFDGVLGLGLPDSLDDGRISILENLVQHEQLDGPLFSLYFVNGNGSTESELLLGGIDNNHFDGTLYELHLSDEATHWGLPLDELSFGDDSFRPEDALTVVLDSMSDIVWLPSNIYAYL